MRDAVNYCLPVIQNPLDGGSLDNGNAGANINTSGNGYYGFLHTQLPKKSKNEQFFERMDSQTCEPSIEFNNTVTMKADSLPSMLNGGQENRKRAWEYGDEAQTFKKKREGEANKKDLNDPSQYHQQPSDAWTITMDSNFNDKKMANRGRQDVRLLEELLEKTHGCSVFHWYGHDL